MSNVIIGIIGVVLFIGLALAGANILGADFMSASSAARAAAISSQLSQMGQAAQVLKIRRGVQIAGSIQSGLGAYLVSQNALKSVPVNGMTGAAFVGADYQGGGSSNELRTIYTDLGTDQKAHDACLEIETDAGNPNPGGVVNNQTAFDVQAQQALRIGCMNDVYFPGHYVAYIVV